MTKLGIEESDCPEATVIGASDPVLKAVEEAVTDEGPAGFEFLDGIPNLPMKFVRSVDYVNDLRFERLQGKVVAYKIGDSIWVSARGVWSGNKIMSVLWRPEYVRPTRYKDVRLDFTVGATVIMQLDDNLSVVAAEVSDRDRVSIHETGMIYRAEGRPMP